MAKELLETFQAHSGIEKLGGERVAKTMDRAALLIQSCPFEVFCEKVSAGAVAEMSIALAIKDELLVLVPSPQPEFDRKQRIIAQIDYSSHAVLLSLEEMNLSALDIQII
jgi:hypothetical protein